MTERMVLDTLRLWRSGLLDRDEVDAILVDAVPAFRHAWGTEEVDRLVDQDNAVAQRRLNGWSPRGMAGYLGCPEQWVHDVEDGKVPLSGERGRLYAAALCPRRVPDPRAC